MFKRSKPIKTIRKFLFLPLTLMNKVGIHETRWLVFAEIEQHFDEDNQRWRDLYWTI